MSILFSTVLLMSRKFSSASKQPEESVYPSMTSSFYKFGPSDSGSISYYDHRNDHSYEVNNHDLCIDEYRRASESSLSGSNGQTAAMNVECERNAHATSLENSVDCKFLNSVFKGMFIFGTSLRVFELLW
ncbi:hypothetical protein GOBAR_AA23725 [Gossypium barbadense]|uniref:Uncharacterized protein n=1 Tax=Gossypium barbadense TaxID=3634 RepID=A0A2P5X0T7_GOSBA|nr:hypothetical protein GOBAR_AA23725 [Gossypium barbadense]